MVYQNEKATVVFDINEKFVMDSDEKEYDIILNPNNIKRNEPHDAFEIIAKTDKTIKIAIIVRHDKDAVFSAMLNGTDFYATYCKDAIAINVATGELISYEKDAVQEEYDFSDLDKMI